MAQFSDLGEYLVGIAQLGGASIVYLDADGGVAIASTRLPEDVARLKALSVELTKGSPHYDCDEVVAAREAGREPKPMDEVPS